MTNQKNTATTSNSDGVIKRELCLRRIKALIGCREDLANRLQNCVTNKELLANYIEIENLFQNTIAAESKYLLSLK